MSPIRDWYWPEARDRVAAQRAIKTSFWTAVFVSCLLTVLAILGSANILSTYDALTLSDAALFAIVAIGLYRNYRTAAVGGVLLYISEAAFLWLFHGERNRFVMVLVFVLASLQTLASGVPGTFAYHRPVGTTVRTVGDMIREIRQYIGVWIAAHRVGIRSLVWLLFAAVVFLIAERLTHHIAFVTNVLGPAGRPGTILAERRAWYIVNVYGSGESKEYAEVNYDYVGGDKMATISIKLPNGSVKVRLWEELTPHNCDYAARNQSFTSLPEASDGAGSVLITLPPGELEQQVWCSIAPRFLQETFTSTISVFSAENLDYPLRDDQGRELIQVPIRLSMNSRDGASEVVTALGHESEGPIVIPPNYHSIVRFRSIHREQDRDWYLVLIGAVVALGAALVVEAMRPYIERISAIDRARGLAE